MEDNYPKLKLENQICFPLYAVSRLITQQYKPLLDKLGVTYPQYLVLLVLWEKDDIPVKAIAQRLFLETNTLTPLLKRMERQGLIKRERSKKDERVVNISLSSEGANMKHYAAEIPEKLIEKLSCFHDGEDDSISLKVILEKLLKGAQSIRT